MKTAILLLLATVMVTLLVYSPIFDAPFLYEDANFVSENPAVHGEQPIQLVRARWLTEVVNRVNWIHNPSGSSFHQVNVAFHVVNGVLIFIVALALGVSPIGAWVAGSIFLLHPLNSESVAYISGRTELLSTMFVLLAAWIILWRDTIGWVRAFVVLFLLIIAICLKESAVVGFGLVLLAAWWKGGAVTLPLAIALLLLSLIPIGVMSWSVFHFDFLALSEWKAIDFLAHQLVALGQFIGMFFIPRHLSVDHDFDLVSKPMLMLGLLGLIVVVYFLYMRRSAHTLLQFGVLWMLIALSPRFVMRITEVLNEHQVYLPFVGLSLILGGWYGGRRAADDAVSVRGVSQSHVSG